MIGDIDMVLQLRLAEEKITLEKNKETIEKEK